MWPFSNNKQQIANHISDPFLDLEFTDEEQFRSLASEFLKFLAEARSLISTELGFSVASKPLIRDLITKNNHFGDKANFFCAAPMRS
jgi:hypothetical protein